MGVYNPGPKKRDIKVIALAFVCIGLAAGLVGVIAVYASNDNSADLKAQIIFKDNLISSLQANNTALQNQLSQIPDSSVYVNQIASLNQQISYLNDQVSGYYNIAIMNVSTIIFSQQPINQDANATTTVFNDAISYSGYVVIQATATANTTFAEVIYSFSGINFDYIQTIGTSGTAVFPVLPGTLQINIGNTNQTDTNSVTATATYHY